MVFKFDIFWHFQLDHFLHIVTNGTISIPIIVYNYDKRFLRIPPHHKIR